MVEEPCRNTPTETRQLPEYWSYPATLCARESPSTPWRESGVRLPWLHYICLVTAIFSMGAALTLWTAIALHGSQLKYEVFRSAMPQAPQHLRSDNYMRVPAIKFNPHIVVGAPPFPGTATVAQAQHMSIVIAAERQTTTITQAESQTSPNTSNESSTSSSTAGSAVESQEPPPTTTTVWLATTLPPIAPVVKPSTRYFHPAASPAV
jgi:hypothetical protein